MDRSWAAVVVLALGMGACRSPALTPGAAATASHSKAKEAAMTEWKGQFSGATRGAQQVVESSAQWQRLWSVIGQSAPAEPDFKSYFAVAVLLGQRNTGGYQVQWREPDSSGTATVVTYKEIKPQGITMQVLTQPYAVKVFPRGKPQILVEAAQD